MSLPPTDTLSTGGTGSHIVALLGPTNTGKTHRAIERMVAFGAGMIGLPLRLLAREVYDRVCARVGARDVALLTGEERIVPHKARFWVCTVESMPINKAVPFVAVDEIQLASHPERGHVFTDRLLNFRGTRETWFMGSDTMRPIIERLVPTAKIKTFERFSKLSYEDPRKLSALPHRSAVVAFSVGHLYELAERIRASAGGAAVVFGALSPHARNAQVEMFESGEVQHMVSTDAIGMGLNLNIKHVFFGALMKYDGQEHRHLEPWEMGQIAGRAGRFESPGFFSLTRECSRRSRLPGGIIDAVERQRFEPVRKIYYRNSDLEFDSVQSLLEGLTRAPFSQTMVGARNMEDERALRMLLRSPDILARANHSPANVELLWDVCRIPDYRQDSQWSHVRILGQIYLQLTDKYGRIEPEWLEGRLRRLDTTDGDIDTMMQRIAYTRTWAYIAHRANWVSNKERWRQRVLGMEARLSAALHDRLTLQFVEERVGVQVPRPVPHGVALDDQGVVTTKTLPLGHIESFSFVPNLEASRLFGAKETRRHGHKASTSAALAQAQMLLDEGDQHFSWGEDLKLHWKGQPLARLERGPRIDAPKLRMMPMDLLPDELRRKIQEVTHGWLKAQTKALAQRFEDKRASGPLRGLLYSLHSRLGVMDRREVRDLLQELTPDDRKTMARLQIRVGVRHIYAMAMLKPGQQPMRAALLMAWMDIKEAPALHKAAVAPITQWNDDFASAMGYPRMGQRCVRIDMLERLMAFLRKNIRKGPAEVPNEPMSWLGCDRQGLTDIMKALKYRFEEDGVYPPATNKRRKKRRKRRS